MLLIRPSQSAQHRRLPAYRYKYTGTLTEALRHYRADTLSYGSQAVMWLQDIMMMQRCLCCSHMWLLWLCACVFASLHAAPLSLSFFVFASTEDEPSVFLRAAGREKFIREWRALASQWPRTALILLQSLQPCISVVASAFALWIVQIKRWFTRDPLSDECFLLKLSILGSHTCYFLFPDTRRCEDVKLFSI